MEGAHLLDGEILRFGYSWRSQHDAHSIESLTIVLPMAEMIMEDKYKDC